MSISNQKYYLDLNSGTRAPVTVHVSQGDVGRTISFSILNNGEPFTLTTESVSVHGTRIDGANFGPFACTYSGNVISFTLKSSMSAVAGSAIAEIVIAKSSERIGTANFAILVEKSTFPDGVSYDTDPSVYEDILTYVQNIDSSITTNAVNTAKAYTDSKVSAEASARVTAIANEQSARESSETTINNRISNLVVNAGGSNITEVVDARVDFSGATNTALVSRLNKFLEYNTLSYTEDI